MSDHHPIGHPSSPDLTAVISLLHEATDSLLGTARGLSPDEWSRGSVLPGWSRAHVLAHLALNAEGLAGALATAENPDPRPMYSSNDDRDADIDRLAASGPNQILGRLKQAAEIFERSLDRLPLDASIERTPGGPVFAADEVPLMRWREVEIHHADLDAGYDAADWPAPFVDYLFPVLLHDRAPEVDLTLAAPEGEVVLGTGGPVIRGSRADLAWWLLGRGTGAGLTGDLPALDVWVRRP